MIHRLKQLSGLQKILVLVTVLAVAAAGIFLAVQFRQRAISRVDPTPGTPVPVTIGSQGNEGGQTAMQDSKRSVSVRLSEGQAQPQEVEPLLQATGEPLPPDVIDQILGRLPAWETPPDDQQEFHLAQDPLPPPQTGQTIEEPFPPADTLPSQQVETGPLEVLRFAPEGEIPLAPFVNITFNQPMVPLGTLADLAASAVPAQIDPPLPGTWRWLGTKTLTFEYDSELIDRLPKATIYRVTVPAGVQSVSGATLAEPVEWTFSTPPPRLVSSYPTDGPQPLEPLFFLQFDQRINAAAVLETVHVRAGGQPVSLRLADNAEIQSDEQLRRLVETAAEGRWLAFRAASPLPEDTSITITVGPGTPSAEGPRVTEDEQSFGFQTYAAFKVVEHGCSWSSGSCPPLTPFFIRFNNPIDSAAFDSSLLRIQPEIPGASINVFGDRIEIQGATKAQTNYRVFVDGQLRDTFGQQLGRSAELTFRVGPAEPLLVGPDRSFITLDPAAPKPVFSVYTLNYNRLEVQIYAVQPSDWPAFKNYLRQDWEARRNATPPGRLVADRTQRIESPADTLTEVGIDLSEGLDGEFGHFIVIVKPPTGLLQREEPWRTITAWVQVTQIGLDAFVDHSEMVAWATSLKDGAPLAGVTIQPGPSGSQAVTDDSGLAAFPIPNGATYLVAEHGADRVILPQSTYYWDDQGWQTRPVYDELRWYVLDDRQMYRPGEELHLKGWLRRVGGKQDGDVGPAAGVTAVSYSVMDPQGNDLGNGVVEVNELGGFDLALTIPERTNLGYAQIYLDASGDLLNIESTQYVHQFQIQEFRRPEFEVIARNETNPPYFAREDATVAVGANYYAGGPLPGAEVTWQVSTSPGHYAPPNWPDFVFGSWRPWWFFEPVLYEFGPGPFPGGETRHETFTGLTDASGNHYLLLDFDEFQDPQPYSVHAEATVMDVNRQAWTGSTDLLVHPASLYVGLRSDRYFVEQGTPLEIEAIVTDLDGASVAGQPMELRAARLEWQYQNDEWQEVEADVQLCTPTSASEPVTCTFDTPLGGSYRITATVTDSQGRQNQSQFTRWVSGGQQPPKREVEQETLTLIPDQETYQPGDTARVLVQSPFSPAEGLLTVTRSGILYTQRFSLPEGTATLEIPIEDRHIPNLNLQVDVVGSAPRDPEGGSAEVPPRPAFATGTLSLSIPPRSRTLSLQITPAALELEPGAETTIAAVVTDANGQPVPGAELAFVVVDEAVLALSNYQLADPLEIFYRDRSSDLSGYYMRSSIVLVDPQMLSDAARNSARDMAVSEESAAGAEPAAEAPMAPMPTMTAAQDGGLLNGAAADPIRVRSDFNPLAAFVPAAITDANGEALIPIKLPDNLTRYRVMVIAADSARQFGLAETNLTARLPLMVRPSAPRFLNFGDRFELPVVLQNQTGEPLEVDVVVRTANLELTGSSGLRVTVPARDRVEVRFPASAQLAGTARIQVAAQSGSFADAATLELPVYTPATTEAFATYGVIDDGAILQPVASPTGVFPQYGGLEISTSSTALQSLTDAVLYLVSYPYECSEQLASRILAIAALRDVLSAFEASGLPAPAELEAAVQRDLERLQGMQNDDGGFPYWRRGQDPSPLNTIHVAHALQMAEQKGFAVNADMKLRTLEYLRQIESHYPVWYSQDTRHTLSAYALYVRDRMSDSDPAKARKLVQDAGLENLSLDAVGWLWPVLLDDPAASGEVEAIRRLVTNRVVETAGAANFTTSYDDQTYLLLASDRRTDAILLEALMVDNPQHDLIPKLVSGLLSNRTRGRWGNTQENVFILLALDTYFNTYEAQTPDFVARVWLGDAYAGSHTFQGRTTDQRETNIPMGYLVDATAEGGSQDLILSKEGPGRLYYRLGLRYAPTDLQLDPLDMGFVVERTYEGVDNPEDVYQDENGAWHIKAGARVRIKVKMVADNRHYHVALVDPLPAGLEIINPDLAVSGSTPSDPGSPDRPYGWWWWGPWYEHQNLRDERAEAFTTLLWDGVYEYTYTARATTPGEFVVPPAKAEEMYSPEVFGRSASALVIVEP